MKTYLYITLLLLPVVALSQHNSRSNIKIKEYMVIDVVQEYRVTFEGRWRTIEERPAIGAQCVIILHGGRVTICDYKVKGSLWDFESSGMGRYRAADVKFWMPIASIMPKKIGPAAGGDGLLNK